MRPSAGLLAILVTATALVGCTNPFDPRPNGPGDLALDYLTNARYSRLDVEVDYVSGSAPNGAALDLLKSRISENTDKGGNVRIGQESEVQGKGRGSSYTLDEIRALEQRHRDQRSEGDTAILYVMYLDGAFAGNEGNNKALAIAYTGSSVVVFKGTIRESSRSDDSLPIGSTKPRERDVEGAVLVHEFGHVVGLVNNGIAMVTLHEDADHPKHSSNDRSVMFWAVESNAVLNIFDLDNIPNDFDSNDKQDMRAARDSS